MFVKFMEIMGPTWPALLDFVSEQLSFLGWFAKIATIPIVFLIFVGAIYLLRLVHRIDVLSVGTRALLWPTVVAGFAFVITGAFHPTGIYEIVAISVFGLAFVCMMVYSCVKIFRMEVGIFWKLLLLIDAAAYVLLTFALSTLTAIASLAMLIVFVALFFLSAFFRAKANPRRVRLSNGAVVTEYEAGRWSGNDGHTYSNNGGGTFMQQD